VAPGSDDIDDRLTSIVEGVLYKSGTLRFTLRGLYELSGANDCIGYDEFRKALYKSDINYRLSLIGYKIDILKSTGKVDSSIYQVVRI
tara:strand:+ start:299 stop:562 length:264 start_codon:yes stop_codon:yes gene_type:complete